MQVRHPRGKSTRPLRTCLVWFGRALDFACMQAENQSSSEYIFVPWKEDPTVAARVRRCSRWFCIRATLLLHEPFELTVLHGSASLTSIPSRSLCFEASALTPGACVEAAPTNSLRCLFTFTLNGVSACLLDAETQQPALHLVSSVLILPPFLSCTVSSYYIWKIVLPLFLSTLLCFSAFFFELGYWMAAIRSSACHHHACLHR